MNIYIKYKDIVKLYLCNDTLKNSSSSLYEVFQQYYKTLKYFNS